MDLINQNNSIINLFQKINLLEIKDVATILDCFVLNDVVTVESTYNITRHGESETRTFFEPIELFELAIKYLKPDLLNELLDSFKFINNDKKNESIGKILYFGLTSNNKKIQNTLIKKINTFPEVEQVEIAKSFLQVSYKEINSFLSSRNTIKIVDFCKENSLFLKSILKNNPIADFYNLLFKNNVSLDDFFINEILKDKNHISVYFLESLLISDRVDVLEKLLDNNIKIIKNKECNYLFHLFYDHSIKYFNKKAINIKEKLEKVTNQIKPLLSIEEIFFHLKYEKQEESNKKIKDFFIRYCKQNKNNNLESFLAEIEEHDLFIHTTHSNKKTLISILSKILKEQLKINNDDFNPSEDLSFNVNISNLFNLLTRNEEDNMIVYKILLNTFQEPTERSELLINMSSFLGEETMNKIVLETHTKNSNTKLKVKI